MNQPFMILPGELIAGKNDLVYVTSITSVHDLVNLLNRENILSVPVYDEDEEKFIGIVDMLDVFGTTETGFVKSSGEINYEDLYNRFTYGLETVGEVVARSPRSQRIIVLSSGESIANAMGELRENHRILVETWDEKTGKKAFRMLSQMDLVRYLIKEDLGENEKLKIEELGLVNPVGGKVISMNRNSRACDAFVKMFEQNLSAVAIVDDEGILVANLSSSDLKGTNQENIGNVVLPISEFVKMTYGEKAAVPITCKPMDNLGSILPKMIIAKVHRLWVTNSAEHPIGIVTQTDIINCLLRTPTKTSM
jgi:CBS domain-containing protein